MDYETSLNFEIDRYQMLLFIDEFAKEVFRMKIRTAYIDIVFSYYETIDILMRAL